MHQSKLMLMTLNRFCKVSLCYGELLQPRLVVGMQKLAAAGPLSAIARDQDSHCHVSVLCLSALFPKPPLHFFPGIKSALSLLPALKSSLAGPFPISYLERRVAAPHWRPLFGNSPCQS